MGKTIKKDQQQRVVRTSTSGAFVVRGKRMELAVCNPVTIAEHLRGKGYQVGTEVKYRGGTYSLTSENGAEGTRYKMVQVREAL